MSTLACQRGDLTRLVTFLQAVDAARREGTHIDANGWHLHLQELDATWNENESDLILTFPPTPENQS